MRIECQECPTTYIATKVDISEVPKFATGWIAQKCAR